MRWTADGWKIAIAHFPPSAGIMRATITNDFESEGTFLFARQLRKPTFWKCNYRLDYYLSLNFGLAIFTSQIHELSLDTGI